MSEDINGKSRHSDTDGVEQPGSPSRSELKEQRIDALLDSCRDSVLQQIIGPFGLTPAMFDDKAGGNVTTTHNFKDGVVATEADGERYDA